MKMTMTSVFVLFVACIGVAIVQGDGTPTTAPTTAPTTTHAPTTTTEPSLIYTCHANGDIILKITAIKTYYSNFAVGGPKPTALPPTENRTQCKVPLSALAYKTENNITLHNCGTGALLYLTRDTNATKQVVGGRHFHEYVLSCDLPQGGVNLTVKETLNASIPDTGETKNVTFDVSTFSLQMQLYPTTPKLGQAVQVNISDNLSKENYILPWHCEATGGNDEQQTLIENGATIDSDLMGVFTVWQNGSATASLYAFKFQTSNTVTLSCNVTICKDKTCVAGAYGGRRRRAVDNIDPDTHTVSATFRIIDKENVDNQESGQNTIRVNPVTVVSLVLVTVTAVLRRN